MRKTRHKIWAALTALLSMTIAGSALADPPPIPGHFFEHEPSSRGIAEYCSDSYAFAFTGQRFRVANPLGPIDYNRCAKRLRREDEAMRELHLRRWKRQFDICVKGWRPKHSKYDTTAEEHCASHHWVFNRKGFSDAAPDGIFACALAVREKDPEAKHGACARSSKRKVKRSSDFVIALAGAIRSEYPGASGCTSDQQPQNRHIDELFEIVEEERGISIFQSKVDSYVGTLEELGFRCFAHSGDEAMTCDAGWHVTDWSDGPRFGFPTGGSSSVWLLQFSVSEDERCVHTHEARPLH